MTPNGNGGLAMPDTFDPESVSYVTSFPEITARHPEPMLRATGKVLPFLDRHCRAMIRPFRN